MYCFLALLLTLTLPGQTVPEAKDLNTIVVGVERLFAQMKDFSSDFIHVDQDSLNRKRQATGHVYLMRPRRMRWEYETPEEQYFVSNGKTVYFYVPADRQVNQEAVREAFDDRMPLMFLLGRQNLRDEFTGFARLAAKPFLPGGAVIQMFPRRKTDLTEVIMEVDPANYQIRRLLLAHSDGSRSEFIFSNIRTNSGLKAAMFDFKPPAGVDVVDGIGR